jgi:hypothetical protein
MVFGTYLFMELVFFFIYLQQFFFGFRVFEDDVILFTMFFFMLYVSMMSVNVFILVSFLLFSCFHVFMLSCFFILFLE